MSNGTQEDSNKTGQGSKSTFSELFSVCTCYPEHCENDEEHGLCWCSPMVVEVGDSKIFIHNDEC